MASASAPPCSHGALAAANAGGARRQCWHRRGLSAGSSASSAGAPQTGQPAGQGKSVSAQAPQNGESPKAAHAAQRSGHSKVASWDPQRPRMTLRKVWSTLLACTRARTASNMPEEAPVDAC